jgi:hypothetical protein
VFSPILYVLPWILTLFVSYSYSGLYTYITARIDDVTHAGTVDSQRRRNYWFEGSNSYPAYQATERIRPVKAVSPAACTLRRLFIGVFVSCGFLNVAPHCTVYPHVRQLLQHVLALVWSLRISAYTLEASSGNVPEANSDHFFAIPFKWPLTVKSHSWCCVAIVPDTVGSRTTYTNKLRGLQSASEPYRPIDATCRRILLPTFAEHHGQRGRTPTAVNLSFLYRNSCCFSFK